MADIDDVRTICVVGAGTMGSQIAQHCALYGYDVHLVDADSVQVERAVQNNRKLLERRVERGKLSVEEMEAALSLVRPFADLEEAASPANFVIEAVVEDLKTKQQVFADLEAWCTPETVLATNSSTIGVSQITDHSQFPERCINMHFFHPVLVMQLVEVMRGPQTAQSTVNITAELAQHIGKEAVVINREIYGLIVNRILAAIKREAFWLAEEGYAGHEDIDRAVRLGLNHPMGPFELSDFSGLDVFYYAALQRYRETGDEQYKPARILEEKVRAGHLGRKTGKGFYDYPGD